MRGHQVFATAVVVSVLAFTSEVRSQDTRPHGPEPSASPHAVAAGDSIIDTIAFSGLRRISPETVRAHIASRAGEKLDSAQIERDVRELGRLGWFETVRAQAADTTDALDPFTPRHVQLVLHLQERAFLTKVDYTGSRLLSRQQIDKLLADKKLTPRLGEPENPVVLHHIALEIQYALAGLGHPDARVDIVRRQSANATTIVQFSINEGPHLSVGRVSFDGHPEFSSKLLRHQMRRLTPDVIFAGLRGRDSYTPVAFEEDRARLLAYYQNHGFREARIGDARVSISDTHVHRYLTRPLKLSRKQLDVAIPIEAGVLYRIASVETTDALQRAVTAHRRTNLLPDAHPGDVYSVRAVENLRRAWQLRVQPRPRDGPAASFRNVEAIPTLDASNHAVHVKLDLSSDPPYIVRRLEFLGNSRFPDRYLRNRILLQEGIPFDDRALEAGLARLARTGYFKPIKKEDVHVETNDVARTADISIRIEERGQQRASLVGGRGQFGSTLGIAYTVFNLLDREELLSSHIEGGPESLQLAVGFAKEGLLRSRGSLALSVFDTFLRPRLTGSVKGPFFTQQSTGFDAAWNYALTNVDALSVSYDLSRSKTRYSPLLPAGITGISVSDVRSETSSHSAAFDWTRDLGNQRIVFGNSVSGGWLGGSENLLRAKAGYGRIFRDPVLRHKDACAFRLNFGGAGSYLVTSANLEYRVPLTSSTEAAGFLDLGSGLLLPNWLVHARPSLIDSTNGILHGSTGIELRWTLPAIGVPLRGYYALNLLRLDKSLLLPDGSLFHAHNRIAAFGWGLGKLF